LAVRAAEPKLAIPLSIDVIPLLVNRAVVATAEQREIPQRRGPTVGPVTDVVPLTEGKPATRERAASVTMVKRAS